MSTKLKWLVLLKWFAVLVALVFAGLLTNYMAGFLFLAFAKMNPLHVTLTTWGDYWSWYHHVPAIKKRLVVALLLSCLFMFLAPALIYSKLTEVKKTLFGEARFATDSEIRKAGLM
ncbi:hypothetical protein [Burkholderia stagnalis]|uniref:hypothetical protein n=1 Tax=Burkholderia stagnalis TaxID=1503054 RepID=UPI00075FFAD6|nr:hypothetical protein [Burkholderia stagnalis]KWN82997.1 hypothetical protein WT91_29560 [Burkholderia stagnalis]KWN96019.1 hypothetical protein WT92_16155 [Burkholderia stagnalis]